MFSMVLVGSGSVSFDTDPDSGSSHFLIRIRIQGNDTDSMDPDPQHWAVVKIILLRVNFQKNMFVFILHISSLLLWEIPAEKGINIK